MWPNLQFPEEILNGELNFLRSVTKVKQTQLPVTKRIRKNT